MHFNVSLECLFGAVRLRADGALVEPLAQMSHLVQFENVVVCERFATDVARIRPLTYIFVFSGKDKM